jgi:hypothetical protein
MFLAELIAFCTLATIAAGLAMALALWLSGAWVPSLTEDQRRAADLAASERRFQRHRTFVAPTFVVGGEAPVVSPSQPPPRRSRRVPAMARTLMGQPRAPIPVPASLLATRRDSSRPAWANLPAREEELVMLVGGAL